MSQNVDFGPTKLLGFCGLVVGGAIAVGVPWAVLAHAGAAGLGGFAATLLSLIGIVGGVSVAVVSVFFSLVVPKRVQQ